VTQTTHNFDPQQIYLRAGWRVIIHREADGPLNMAVDEAIAEAVGAGSVPPTLRFYAWHPACLSLGYSQPAADVDFERLEQRGWDVVRRLTGGRGILHTDELTYSVAVPEGDPRVAGGVVESYRRLSQGLLAGLERIGAPVNSKRADRDSRKFRGAVCFEVPSDYELTVDGRKLIGSAQTRRRNRVVMQHGALPLSGDLGRICEALAFDSEADREAARRRVLERAITLEEALGRRVLFDEAARALIEGFGEALNLDFAEQGLTEKEKSRAEDLRATRYASMEWTGRR
jgi:lipoate-protein ligase A